MKITPPSGPARGWPDFTAARHPRHRYVAVDAGTVIGWVAVSATSRGPPGESSAKAIGS